MLSRGASLPSTTFGGPAQQHCRCWARLPPVVACRCLARARGRCQHESDRPMHGCGPQWCISFTTQRKHTGLCLTRWRCMHTQGLATLLKKTTKKAASGTISWPAANQSYVRTADHLPTACCTMHVTKYAGVDTRRAAKHAASGAQGRSRSDKSSDLRVHPRSSPSGSTFIPAIPVA